MFKSSNNAPARISAVVEGLSPKEFLKRLHPAKVPVADPRRRIGDFDLSDYGIEHNQYWQGVSTMHTNWDEVYVGQGDDPHEAADDAISQASEDWNTEGITNEMPEVPSVGAEIDAQAKEEAERQVSRDSFESDEEYNEAIAEKTEEIIEEGEWELSYYVVLWIREWTPEDAQVGSLREAEPVGRVKQFIRKIRDVPPGWPHIKRWYNADNAGLKQRRAFVLHPHFHQGQQVERPALVKNTKFMRYPRPGEHSVRFHHTDVLYYDGEGNIMVQTGGWKTNSTRERINTYAPFGWKLAKYQYGWYWWNHDWPVEVNQELWADRRGRQQPRSKYWIPFNDGDTIQRDGTLKFHGGTITTQGQLSVQEGRYLDRLARDKRVKAKYDKMREVNKRLKAIEDLDKPDKQEEGQAKDFIKKVGASRKLTVGEEISHGNSNYRHLIGACLDTLAKLDPRVSTRLNNDPEVVSYLEGHMADDEVQAFEADFLNERLAGIMSNYVPPFTYFGSHPGDGSRIGCWPYDDFDYQELAQEGKIMYAHLGTEEADQIVEGIGHTTNAGVDYGIVYKEYYSYTCYDRNGKVVWDY